MASIVLIVSLILLHKTFGIYIIPIGYILGSFLQMVYLIRKSKLRLKIFNYNFSLKDYKKFIPSTLLFIILIESIGQLYLIVDRYFYNYVPTGGIAALNYAQTLFILPVSIISIALSTAIFPKFSKLISSNNIIDLENSFNESIKINITFFIPITILFLGYGDFILKILFERGKFSHSDTVTTYNALIYYTLSLLFYAAYSINNKMLYSFGLIKKLLYLTLAGILIKIILNFLLVRNLQQNGLALSTSISYIFFFLTSLILIYQKSKFKNKNIFYTELIFNIGNGIISYFIANRITSLFKTNSIAILINILFFLMIYFLNLYFVKHSTYIAFQKVLNSLKYSK